MSAATNGATTTGTAETETTIGASTTTELRFERERFDKMQEALDSVTWRSRCAQKMSELDPDLTRGEAERLAKDIYAFERTRAMAPEAAAEFVSIEMSRPERAPFERRSAERLRSAGSPS